MRFNVLHFNGTAAQLLSATEEIGAMDMTGHVGDWVEAQHILSRAARDDGPHGPTGGAGRRPVVLPTIDARSEQAPSREEAAPWLNAA